VARVLIPDLAPPQEGLYLGLTEIGGFEMNVIATLERDGEQTKAVIRQMDHDPKLIIGRKFKYGPGKCWIVKKIEVAQ